MSKEYKFVIEETSYRHITIEADSYDAAKAEFMRDYEDDEYVDVREEVSTELLMRCEKCGKFVDIDRISDDGATSSVVCPSCRNKAILR